MSDAIRQQWQAATQPPRDAMPPDGTALVAGLVDREVIVVSGSEARAFLQAILTQDIASLADDAATFAALCNAKGRTLGLFRVVAHDDRFFLVTRADIAPALQKRLQMYVLRRDVQIERLGDWVALGVILPDGLSGTLAAPAVTGMLERLAGPQGEDAPRWPAGVDTDGLLYVREEVGDTRRIAIHGPIDRLQALVESVPAESRVATGAWDRAEIEDRIPLVDSDTAEHFVPQWINLDELGAFSLKKGCYPGQEVIARLYYLGKPNRRLFVGHALALDPPAPGTPVETTAGSTAGEVVRSAPLPDASGSIILAVIKLKHLHDSLSIDGLALSIDQHGAPGAEMAQAGTPH